MKRLGCFLACGLLMASVALGGCGWMGRTAGKAQAKIERKMDTMEDSYDQGYAQEKQKTAKPAEKQP